MFNYRKTLYQDYYSTHSGKSGETAQKSHFEQQKRYFGWEFKAIMPIDKRVKILDIGCGTGSFLAAMNELGYTNTQGIDLSPEQVKMALKFGVQNVELHEANDYLSKHQEAFDVICAIDLIEHLSKDELVDFLSSVKKALKSGGMVVFRTPNMDAPQSSVFAFADFTHEVFLNKNSAFQLLASCGFSDVEIKEGIMYIENPMKEIVRKVLWFLLKFWMKLMLFATARTWHDAVFTTNIVIVGRK